MQQDSNHELDAVDILILKELARDGRLPIKHLAAKASVSHHIARNRLERMVTQGIVKVAAVKALHVSDSTVDAFMGLNIKPGCSVHTAAEKLSVYGSLHIIALASGPYDIVASVSFESLGDLSTFLRREIGEITEIASSETLINLGTIKSVLAYPLSETSADFSAQDLNWKVSKKLQTDALDTAIIEELQKNGRVTVVELAKTLGASRASIATRLQRLLSEKIISVVAITVPGSVGYKVTARIGVKVHSGNVEEVARKLAKLSMVHYVAVTLGYYDIMLGVHFTELDGLSDFTSNVLGQILEITKVDEMIYLKMVKSSV